MKLHRLSKRQGQILSTIENLSRDRGFPPTLKEVADTIGLSQTRCKQLTDVLIRRGRLWHTPRLSRSWIVAKRGAK